MGGLVLNPDHTGEPTVKLSDRVFDEEFHPGAGADDDLGPAPGDGPAPVAEKEEKEPKRTKFMGFSLDTKYPRTLKGFIRVLQVILLLVSMIATLLQSPWPDQGAFTFFLLITIVCALASGFLVFTVMAGNQSSDGFCGISWIKLELLYFLIAGVLVFIAACVAASKANGLAALSAAAAFAFLSVITFVICIIWAWKRYKKQDEDDPKKDEEKNEDGKSDLPPDDDPNKMQEFRINMLDENKDEDERKLSRHPSMQRNNSINRGKYNSNPEEMRNNGRFNQSDKDSAYSEGGDFERDQMHRSLPTNARRTGNFQGKGSLRRVHSKHRYPKELNPRTLSNHHHNNHQKRENGGVPNWLHAAMESDDESILPRVQSKPIPQQGKFPLLPTSDEESIAYPSVSQTLGPDGRPATFHNPNTHHRGRGHRTMPHSHSHGHRRKGIGGHVHLPHKMHRGHHGGNHGGHRHRHSRRRKNGHHRHSGRHQQNNHPMQNHVNHGADFTEFGKPIDTGSRRVIPEQPASIHFPEQSRWDDFGNQR